MRIRNRWRKAARGRRRRRNLPAIEADERQQRPFCQRSHASPSSRSRARSSARCISRVSARVRASGRPGGAPRRYTCPASGADAASARPRADSGARGCAHGVAHFGGYGKPQREILRAQVDHYQAVGRVTLALSVYIPIVAISAPGGRRAESAGPPGRPVPPRSCGAYALSVLRPRRRRGLEDAAAGLGLHAAIRISIVHLGSLTRFGLESTLHGKQLLQSK